MINKNALSKYFYEQCAGSTAGHMAMIPNNPVLFGLIKSMSGDNDQTYAATQTEFAGILRHLADGLDHVKEQS